MYKKQLISASSKATKLKYSSGEITRRRRIEKLMELKVTWRKTLPHAN